MHDPIVEMLSPASAQVALVVNETSPDMARALHEPDLCFTGKSDINLVCFLALLAQPSFELGWED